MFQSYHLHLALQFADASSLALSGTNVAQVVNGDGRTDADIHVSHYRGGNKTAQSQIYEY